MCVWKASVEKKKVVLKILEPQHLAVMHTRVVICGCHLLSAFSKNVRSRSLSSFCQSFTFFLSCSPQNKEIFSSVSDFEKPPWYELPGWGKERAGVWAPQFVVPLPVFLSDDGCCGTYLFGHAFFILVILTYTSVKMDLFQIQVSTPKSLYGHLPDSLQNPESHEGAGAPPSCLYQFKLTRKIRFYPKSA